MSYCLILHPRTQNQKNFPTFLLFSCSFRPSLLLDLPSSFQRLFGLSSWSLRRSSCQISKIEIDIVSFLNLMARLTF